MIELKNITKEYSSNNNRKEKIVGVKNVSLTIKEGEIFGIVGHSGAGKSTLLRCINILERPNSGSVIVNGVDLLKLSPKELRKARRSIGMIFQGFHLIKSKTVYENIAFALNVTGAKEQVIKERVEELLTLVNLLDRKDQYPSQLSGGQKQRVSIARALANNPKILLCDEATSALDPNSTKAILDLLKRINKELGLTIVIITHEMEVVKNICQCCAVMKDGHIVEEGPTYEIFSNPIDPLTKNFIQTVLDFEMPARLIERVKGKLLKLQFTGERATEPVISELLKTFPIRGNILHGKVEYIQDIPLGIFVLDLFGENHDLENAMHYLRNRVHKVEVIENEPSY